MKISLLVELEIGMADVESFRKLLPDDLYQQMDYGTEPWLERLQSFTEEDLIFKVGDKKLAGLLIGLEAGERVKRDAVSGEPLPNDGDAVPVIRAQLAYNLEGTPDKLVFGTGVGMARASIGYVIYHKKVAVNDFRYLTPSQVLMLDWEDPFYSAFSKRGLNRQYSAPMSGFIYVEPYEVRKEIVLRPKDLQYWVDLGLEGKDTIAAEDQAEISRRVGEFLRDRQPVLIDGEAVEPELARVNFLERTLKASRVIDPPVDIDADSATVGVIFVYPTVEPLPEKVTMEWDMFNERIQQVPASSVDQAGPLPTYLDPEMPDTGMAELSAEPAIAHTGRAQPTAL